MRQFSFHNTLIFGLLVAGPLAAGFSVDGPANEVDKRYVVGTYYISQSSSQTLTFC